jgi:beta-lactam-binding protein with PASTA domain
VATATQILAGLGFGIEVSSERKDSSLPPDRIADQSPSGRGVAGQKIIVYLSTGNPQAGPTTKPTPPGRRRGPGPPGPGPGG